MAELFWWFEVVKPSFVQPRVFNPDGTVLLHENIVTHLLSNDEVTLCILIPEA